MLTLKDQDLYLALKNHGVKNQRRACHLFNRIEVGRDYKISVELNMTYQQFCSEWSSGGYLKTAPTV